MIKSVLVVGDVMLDTYIIGEVNRLSPEAPVPVLRVTRELNYLGGAANVARNLRELDMDVTLVGLIGKDKTADTLLKLLNKYAINNLLLSKEEVITTRKIRPMTNYGKTQLLRIDEENAVKVNIDEIADEVKKIAAKSQFIVVSDYAKGVVTPLLMRMVDSVNVPIVLDPKPINSEIYKKMKNIMVSTPNTSELKAMTIHPTTYSKYVFETKGPEGICVHRKNKSSFIVKPERVEIFNVIGAGDVVTAVVAKCISAGMTIEKTAAIACACASRAVTEPWTAIVDKSHFYNVSNEYKEMETWEV